MSAAALPGGAGEHGGDSLPKALVVIGDDQAHTAQATRNEVTQEGGPAGAVFARDDVAAQDLAVAFSIDTDCGDRSDVDDAPAIPALLGLRVDP